jgi:hypothetical protein
MTDNEYEHLKGKLVAQHLLLRGLYTQWAMNAPDPVDAIRSGISGLMDTVRENAPPQNAAEHRVYDHMDVELTQFMLSVQERLELLTSQTT